MRAKQPEENCCTWRIFHETTPSDSFFRGGKTTVGPLLLGSDELRALRGEVDTAVYTTTRREVSLRGEDFSAATRLVDAILEARQAA